MRQKFIALRTLGCGIAAVAGMVHATPAVGSAIAGVTHSFVTVQFIGLHVAESFTLIPGEVALASGAVSITIGETARVEYSRAGQGRVAHASWSWQNGASFGGWARGLAAVSGPDDAGLPVGHAQIRNEVTLSMTVTNNGLIDFDAALFDVRFSAFLPSQAPSTGPQLDPGWAGVRVPPEIASSLDGGPMAFVRDPARQEARAETSIRGDFASDHHFCSATGSPGTGGSHGIFWIDRGSLGRACSLTTPDSSLTFLYMPLEGPDWLPLAPRAGESMTFQWLLAIEAEARSSGVAVPEPGGLALAAIALLGLAAARRLSPGRPPSAR